MVEIFSNLPIKVKEQIDYFVNLIFTKYAPIDATKILLEYVNSTEDEEEKEFIDFCVNKYFEQLKGE